MRINSMMKNSYFDYWLPTFKKWYFKFKITGNTKAIVELEDEIWKNWNLSKKEKKKILKQIRGG